MNILFVSAVLPYPLHSGGQIRMYQLLSRLGRKHAVTLASFIRSDSERAYADKFPFLKDIRMVMRGRAWQPKYVASAVAGTYPFLLATYDNAAMKHTLTELMAAKQYDVLHLEPFYVWPSVPPSNVPVVVSEHNVEYDVYASYARHFPVPLLRPFLRWDIEKLRKWERTVWRKATKLTAVSTEDAEAMESYLSRKVNVVPNGVDLRSFPFRKPKITASPVILFVGNFRWLPNRQAARLLADEVYPRIKQELPGAILRIVGRDIPGTIADSARAAGGVVVRDADDIAREYASADILVAPHAISGGTKFKMLEAMASGLPVVTSRHGMFGLAAEEGIHYLEAETPREYAEAVLMLAGNPVRATRIAQNARKLVETRYDWDAIAVSLEATWKNAYESQ